MRKYGISNLVKLEYVCLYSFRFAAMNIPSRLVRFVVIRFQSIFWFHTVGVVLIDVRKRMPVLLASLHFYTQPRFEQHWCVRYNIFTLHRCDTSYIKTIKQYYRKNSSKAYH